MISVISGSVCSLMGAAHCQRECSAFLIVGASLPRPNCSTPHVGQNLGMINQWKYLLWRIGDISKTAAD